MTNKSRGNRSEEDESYHSVASMSLPADSETSVLSSHMSESTEVSKGITFNMDTIAASRRAMISGRPPPPIGVNRDSIRASRQKLRDLENKMASRKAAISGHREQDTSTRSPVNKTRRREQGPRHGDSAEHRYDVEKGDGNAQYRSMNVETEATRNGNQQQEAARYKVEESDDEDSLFSKEARKPYVCVVLSLVSVMLISGIVALSFVVFAVGGDKPLPILTARQEALHDIITSISTTESLVDSTSPQYRAHQWILYEDSLGLSPASGDSRDRVVQRYALAVFFFATGGFDAWKTHSWMEGDECQAKWTGTDCSDSGELRILSLSNQGLAGSIPAELGRFSNLQHIIIKNNPKLTGKIPSSIGHLPKLRQLGLYNNNLSGIIPSELYLATNLQFLNVQNNRLSGILAAKIETLTRLETLVLMNNNLEGDLPFGALASTRLKYVGLSNNKFSGTLSPYVGLIDTLEYLYLDENDFNGNLPTAIDRLTNLKSLNLDGNDFSGTIPASVAKLTDLEFLSMQANGFDGSIPPELGQLTSLTDINLGQNALTGSLPNLSLLTKLQNLLLLHNRLAGSIPESIFKLSALEVLFLSSNQLSGTVPSNIQNLHHELRGLYLSDNKFNGEIDDGLCHLTKLEALFLDENSFDGTIPPCIGDLQNLRQFYIFKNKLTGEVPKEISELTWLNGLGLEENQLRGSVPDELCAIKENSNEFDLWADCADNKIGCSCCDVCCPSESCM